MVTVPASVAVVIGLVLLALLVLIVVLLLRPRQAFDVQWFVSQLGDLQRRVEELQRATPTQQQVSEVTSGLSQAQHVLTRLTENLRSLSDFTQQTLHRQASEQLQHTLRDLSKVDQALQSLAQNLSDDRGVQAQRHETLQSDLKNAMTVLGEVRSTLDNIVQNLRSDHQQVRGSLIEVQNTLVAAKTIVETIQAQVQNLATMEKTIGRIEASVGQLTSVLSGRGGGQAAERLVNEVLSQIPQDWIMREVRLGNGIVEFAIVMPGGYLVPLDSKFVGAEVVSDLENSGDETRQREVEQRLSEQVRIRAREVIKYLTDQRSVGFGIAAVPDSVYNLCLRAIPEAARNKVVLVPYKLLVPFVLSLYLIAQRLGISARLGDTQQAIGASATALQHAIRELENMAREITTVSNQRERALDQLRAAERYLSSVQGDQVSLPDVDSQNSSPSAE